MGYFFNYLSKRSFHKVENDFSGNARLPERKTALSAGYDFYLAQDITIAPRSLGMAHSGIAVDMYDTDVLIITPRSSTCKRGLILMNSPSIIDADYHGEIMFPLYNLNDYPITLKAGERVTQGIFLKYNTLGDVVTQQRVGGFGSTKNF